MTKPIHGVTCEKRQHDDIGHEYLHEPDDDGPFEVDGYVWCGRCHHFIEKTMERVI